MMRDHYLKALLLLALSTAGTWHQARAADFRCGNGDLIRRIELSRPEGASDGACEVRYWRDATAGGTGQVLWRANRNTAYCEARARELIGRLEAGGWVCTPSAQPAAAKTSSAARAAPPVQRSPMPALKPAPPAGDADARAPAAVAAQTDAGAPTPPPEPAEASGQTTPPPPGSHAPILNQIIEQTLASVEQLYGGEFQADVAEFGDLNGDGLDDAAVLVTYQADRQDYVQYLVVYLFDGETFRSVATKNVGGRFLDALRAELQGISDRRILVDLQALDGGATCCATRRTAFALRGGQLVEIERPGSRPPERTSRVDTPPSG